MRIVNIETVGGQLSALVTEAQAEGEIALARDGQPVARLVPVEQARRRLLFGTMKGQFTVPDDFDEMFADEIRDMFEGD